MRELMGNGDEVREDGFLPGFRFHPTDQELVGFYLRRKVERKALCVEIIKQVDIYKYDPWDLPTASGHDSKEWYFFCMRGRKYRNSVRPNRVTGSGFWKATGIDRPIYKPGGSSDCIGLKKSLVYYLGSAGKGQKTDWMMHEFRLPSNSPGGDAQEAELWTICRIFKRNVSCKRYSPPQTWESPAPAADSSSKTSSGESEGLWDGVNNYQEASALPAFMEGDLNHWSSPLQASPLILHEEMISHGSDLFFKDEWEEIGRMMEVPVDPASLVYECIY